MTRQIKLVSTQRPDKIKQMLLKCETIKVSWKMLNCIPSNN